MFRDFRLNILFRVILIVMFAMGVAYFLLQRGMFFVPFVFTLFLTGTVYSLVRYVEKSTRELTHLLLSVREGAFTDASIAVKSSSKFEKLTDTINILIREFASLNRQKELNYQFLQALNDNINVGIICFEPNGSIAMMNPAAKKLLRAPSLNSITDLESIDTNLYSAIHSIRPDQRFVIRCFIRDERIQLNVQSKEIVLDGKPMKIVLLQNLNHELDEKEMDAWQQLMSVLTHEIMNSVTPIVTLASAVQGILKSQRESGKEFTPDNKEDISDGIDTIVSRSRGLLAFIQSYKSYAKPIQLKLETADLRKILDHVHGLMKAEIKRMNIQFRDDIKFEQAIVQADVSLLQQVFINIIQNAIDAVAHDGSGEIALDISRTPANTILVSVSDNGEGMNEETLEKAFIPFYTTKQRGTGVGLSLSRQIIKLHHGTIMLDSRRGKGTTVVVGLEGVSPL